MTSSIGQEEGERHFYQAFLDILGANRGTAVSQPVGTGTSVLVGTILSPMTWVGFFQIFAGIFIFSMVGGALESCCV